MTVVAGLVGAVVGALVGTIATYLTTRSTMRLELVQSYDRALLDKRLERYTALFRLTSCLPRYWLPEETPTRKEILRFRQDFKDWYFESEAGGMFLTDKAKRRYMDVITALVETAEKDRDTGIDTPLDELEAGTLQRAASELRHQLAEDVGSSHPPRLRWRSVGPTTPPTRSN